MGTNAFIAISVGLALMSAPAIAATVEDIDHSVAAGQWSAAQSLAKDLDSKTPGTDFYAGYVAANRLIAQGDCNGATQVLDILSLARPTFLPAHQLSYLCKQALGDADGARDQLDIMLAILPDGPQREVVVALKRKLLLRQAPVFDVYGDVVPSTNVERLTSADHLGIYTIPGSARAKPGVTAMAGSSVAFALFDEGWVSSSIVGRGELSYSTITGLLSPAFELDVPVTFQPRPDTVAVITPTWRADFDGSGLSQLHAGVSAVASYAASQQLSIGVAASSLLARYPTAAYRDGIENAATLSVSYAALPELLLTGKLAGTYDHAWDATQRSVSADVTMRADWAAPWTLLLAGQLTLGRRWHSGPPPLSADPIQIDTYASARIEASSLALNLGPFRPTLYYEFNTQISNNVFYQFTSHDVGLTLKAKL
jgi:hypothetical protein